MNASDLTGRPARSSIPVLEVRGLRVEMAGAAGAVELVDDVHLTVARGETVGLVGESGSGKTVTSLALMRLLPGNARTSGEVLLDGKNLLALSAARMSRVRGREIGMIFQEPRRSLNPAFSVGNQVAESVRRHAGVSRKAAWARAVELLDMVGIADAGKRASAYPHEFSGGMCQRVMLAVALAGRPRVLIADEPTTALDVTVRRQVLDLIGSLQQELGLAVLLITHDLGLVAEVCDRVSVMYAGRIVEQAGVTTLFDRPAHPYAAGLLHSMPDVDRHRERMGFIPGIVPAPRDFVDACRFAARCPYRVNDCERGAVPLRSVGPDHAVRCTRAGEIDLEEAFL